MAETFKLIEENTQREIDLVYASGSQTSIKILEQRIRAFESDVLTHRPDDGHDVPVRLKDPAIEGYFEIASPGGIGTNWDIPQDTVTALKRWVDGADQQAFKAYNGDGNKIKLKGALNGQSDYAYHTVMYGFIDDGASYYGGSQNQNYVAHPITIFLRLEPAGIGDPIILKNDLPSSPHFVEDSNSDGLADGWELQAGATASLNTSFYVIGGQSQTITGTINSGTMLINAGTGIMAQAWARDSGTPRFQLRDGGATLISNQTASNSSSADSTFTDLHGNTWYRVTKYAVNAAANAYMELVAGTDFDGCRVHALSDYLANCGFETAGGGAPDYFGSWTESAGDGAIADATGVGEYHTGAHAAKLTTGATANTHLYQAVTVIPGRNYTVRFWTRSTSGDGASRYGIYDATNSVWIQAVTSSGVTGTTYTEVTDTFTAPPGCTSAILYLYCSATDTDIVYFDDVIIHPTGIENGWISTTTLFNRNDTGRELLSNTGFETAGGGGADVFGSWAEGAGTGAIADEVVLFQSGAHAAKLTSGATADTYLSQNIVVVPGRSYMVQFYTRSTTGDGASRYGVYDVTNAADIVATSSTGITGETYTLFQKRFTAPATCVSVGIFLRCSATDTDVVYFDEVHVYDEAAINYVDTWGLPGDCDALASVLVQENPQDSVSATAAVLLGARGRDGLYNASDVVHWVEDADLGYGAGTGTWSTVTDTTRTDNRYRRFSATGDTSVTFTYVPSAAIKKYLMDQPRRIFAIVRTSDSANVTVAPLSISIFGYVSKDKKQLSADNTWQLLDLGSMNSQDVIAYRTLGGPSYSTFLQFEITTLSNGDTIDIDALMFLPTDELCLADMFLDALSSYDWLVDAIRKKAEGEHSASSYQPIIGSLYHLAPGDKSTRTVLTYPYQFSGDAANIDITDNIVTTFTVYPRTRHLLNPGVTIP